MDLKGVFIAFIVIVIGVAFLSSTADTISPLKDTYAVTNTSFTASNSTAVVFDSTADHNVTAISQVRSTNGTVLTTNNYTASVSGRSITMKSSWTDNTGNKTETWYVDYSWQSNSFIDDGSSRSLVALIIIFFALGIFGVILQVTGAFDFGDMFKRK